MGAIRYDLSKANGLEVHQGYDYGPIRFKIRGGDFEKLTLEITAVGAEDDVISLELFGSDSDRPELLTTLTHTTTATDTLTTIAADFADQLNALELEYVIPSGGSELYSFTASSAIGVVTFSTSATAFHLDASETATETATADLAVVVDVLVDLTGAVVEASGKLLPDDETKLFYWSTTGGEFTIASGPLGLLDLDVPRATTAGYEWDSCQWELSILTDTDDRKSPYMVGCAENVRTLQ